MKSSSGLALLCAGALAVVATVAAGTAQPSGGLVLPQDKGPAQVDVSDYPSNIQADYKVVEKQCAKCHTLARALNTSMPASFWARYVGTVMKKPEYGISLEDANKIYEFLAYDQAVRKDRTRGLYPALTEDELQQLKEKQGK